MYQFTKENDGKVAVLLAEAADLVSKGWTKASFARTATGNPIGAEEETACSFCALGALQRSVDRLQFGPRAYYAAMETLIGVIPHPSIPKWNDEIAESADAVAAAMIQAAKRAAEQHRAQIAS